MCFWCCFEDAEVCSHDRTPCSGSAHCEAIKTHYEPYAPPEPAASAIIAGRYVTIQAGVMRFHDRDAPPHPLRYAREVTL